MESISTMGSGSLGRELDLEVFVTELESHIDGPLEANFANNGMVTIRLDEGGPAYTLYRTGSFQIRGAKTEELLYEASSRFRKVLSEIDIDVPEYKFSHVTSVFGGDLDQDVNLEALTIALGMEDTEYEPEQFPGLIYRPPEYQVTLLVFASGKIIVGGT
ncbi:MAG: transcription factor, partial [Halobacteriaceae archaeon]